MVRSDVVDPILKALGHAAHISGFRRRRKRLKASTSGASHMSGPAEVNSEDLDEDSGDATYVLSRTRRSP